MRPLLFDIRIGSSPKLVMAGLGPAIHVLLRDRVVEIDPIGIYGDDHSRLPRSRPMLDVALALDCDPNVFKLLEVDKPLQAISFCKAFYESGAMFKHPTDEVVRYAHIEDAVWSIAQNVNVSTRHLRDSARRGWPGQARP